MDAEVLAEAVATRPQRLDLAFRHYEKERRRHVAFYQWVSRVMMPFFQSDLAVLGVFRDFFVPKLCRIPWTRRQMLEVLAGLKLSPWEKLKIR
jgi:2-polyprenyl-6-methoxyphenol hydroxylase-like FAD-dependent oxidoreductase